MTPSMKHFLQGLHGFQRGQFSPIGLINSMSNGCSQIFKFGQVIVIQQTKPGLDNIMNICKLSTSHFFFDDGLQVRC